VKKAPTRTCFDSVEGAPFSIGESVVVSSLSDDSADPSFLFKRGIVDHLDYTCGCGQTYPQDPMIGVRFPSGEVEEFWREELRSATPSMALRPARPARRTSIF